MKKLFILTLIFPVLFLAGCASKVADNNAPINNNIEQVPVVSENTPVATTSQVAAPIVVSSTSENVATTNNVIPKDWSLIKNDKYYFEFYAPSDSSSTEILFGQKQVIPQWQNGVSVKKEVVSNYYSLEKRADSGLNAFYSFKVIVYPNTNKILKDISSCKAGDSEISCEKVKINGTVDAYKITYNSTQAVPGSDFHFIYKGSYYVIQHSIKPQYKSNVSNVGADVFKTFKLLE
ncbi:MAG: hypothetical protein WCK37_04395 [Candidatus Falkowbacteria bacterium]